MPASAGAAVKNQAAYVLHTKCTATGNSLPSQAICEPIDPEIPSLTSHAVQLIQRDREVAHARSGRMIDRVGNRRGDADDPDLAKPLDAERVGVVRLVHEDDLAVREPQTEPASSSSRELC